jgi:hypothetical protein
MSLPFKKDHNLITSAIPVSGDEICIVNDVFDPITGRETSKRITLKELGRYLALNDSRAIRAAEIKVPYDITLHQGASTNFVISVKELVDSYNISLPARVKFIKDGKHYPALGSYIIEDEYISAEITSVTPALTGIWSAKIYDTLNRIFETNAWQLDIGSQTRYNVVIPDTILLDSNDILTTEDGITIVTETGIMIFLEEVSTVPNFAFLTETSEPFLTEDSKYLLSELSV